MDKQLKQKQPQEVLDKKRKGHSKKKGQGSSSQDKPSSSVIYSQMPDNHKKKWYIDNDVGTSLQNYVELISWVRTMSCIDGSVFEDIQSSHCSKGKYPLLEIQVIIPKDRSADKSTNFIIKKSDLYLIACSIQDKVKFQFNDTGYNIDGFKILEYYDGRYTTKPWEDVGPKSMINSINILSGINKNIDININKVNMDPYIEACQVFYVHLCEAARMNVIQSLICKTLRPMYTGEALHPTYAEEAEHCLPLPDGDYVAESDDVYSLIKGDGPLNLHISEKTPASINVFIHSYNQLCKTWLMYSLSEKKHFIVDAVKVAELKLRSIKSLRGSLGVLGTTSLKIILEDCETMRDNGLEGMTAEDYDKIERRIFDLYAQDKVIDNRKEKNDS